MVHLHVCCAFKFNWHAYTLCEFWWHRGDLGFPTLNLKFPPSSFVDSAIYFVYTFPTQVPHLVISKTLTLYEMNWQCACVYAHMYHV